jgi:hypothetical protein
MRLTAEPERTLAMWATTIRALCALP